MADSDKILVGEYKGVPIFWKTSTLTGGRELSVKRFPNRDTQSVEDMGLIPRSFRMGLVVGDLGGMDYFSYRNQLLAALESAGPGVFIHPLYGRIESVHSGQFDLDENTRGFGDHICNVTFEVSKNTGIPQTSGVSISEISAANDAALAALAADIAENYSVNPSYIGNFEDQQAQLADVQTAVSDSIEFAGEDAENLNAFNQSLDLFTNTIPSMILSGATLANSVLDLFEEAYAVYESPEAKLSTMLGFFGFGEDDVAIIENTAVRIERLKARMLLNGVINSTSLGYAYQAVSGINFETVQDVEDVRQSLDEQYKLVRSSSVDSSVKDALADLRLKTLELLEIAQLKASQIVTVYVTPTSCRLLSFGYYGDESNGERIAEINSIYDVGFIQGDIDILTA